MKESLKLLLLYDYPFVWQIRTELQTIPERMIDRLNDQLNEKVFENEFHFEHLMLYVGLAYEHGFENRNQEALNALETAENKLKEFTADFSSRNVCKALQHIIFSTKAHLLLEEGNLDTAAEVMSTIPSVKDMDNNDKAALKGLRAVFFGEYGINGSKLALELSAKAIKMNPDESLWYFLKAKYLGRIRRVERPYDVPELEERDLLERAMEDTKKNASYTVFTAQMYRETAKTMFRKHSRNPSIDVDQKSIYALNEKSLKYYDESINLKPECSHMMFRCAKGYISFPPAFRNKRLERAETLLKRGLEISPDSGYGNHVMAQYYERVKKQPEEAIKHLRICEKKKIFGAAMDLLRLEYRMDKNIDLVQRLTNLLDVYHEETRKCQLYSQLISYHVFISNNLDDACSFVSEVMRMRRNCEDMVQHQSLSIQVWHERFNLYDVLIDQIRIRMLDTEVSDEKKKFYEKFLNEMFGIKVPSSKPQYLKGSIMNAYRTFQQRPHDPRFQRHRDNLPTKSPQYSRDSIVDTRNTKPSVSNPKLQQWRSNQSFQKHRDDLPTKLLQYSKNGIVDTCHTQPSVSNPKFQQRPDNQGSQKRPYGRNDVHGNMNTFHHPRNSRPLVQDQEWFRNQKTNYNSSASSSSFYNWRSKQQQEDQRKGTTKEIGSKNEDINTPKTGKSNILVTRGNESEESDDTSFRMMIYEKSKMKKVNKPNDIVIPLQDMKIQDESTEKSEICAPEKDDAFSLEIFNKIPSVKSVCEMDTGPKDGLEFHAVVSSNKNASNDDSKNRKENNMKYSRRTSHSPDDEKCKSIDSRRLNSQSDDHKLKHSLRKRNPSNSESEDNSLKYKSGNSRQIDKMKHSYQRKNSGHSDDDSDGMDCRSVRSRQSDSQFHHRKSKHSYKENSKDKDVELKYNSSDSRKIESQSRGNKSKQTRNDDDGRSGSRQSKSRSLKYSRRGKYESDSGSNSEYDSDYSKKSGSRSSKRPDDFKDDLERKSNFLERGDVLEESNLESSCSKEGSRLKHRSSRHDYYRSSKSHKFDGSERDDSQSPVHEERKFKYSSTKRHSEQKGERHKYHRSGKHHKLSSLEREDSQSPIREKRKSEYSRRRGHYEEDDELELRPSRRDYHRGEHIHHEVENLERGDSRSLAHHEHKSKYSANRRSKEKGERYSHHSSGKQDKFCYMGRKSKHSHRKESSQEEEELGCRSSPHDSYHSGKHHKLDSLERENKQSKYSRRKELSRQEDERSERGSYDCSSESQSKRGDGRHSVYEKLD